MRSAAAVKISDSSIGSRANTLMNTLRRIGEFRRLFLFAAVIASRVFPVEMDSERKANVLGAYRLVRDTDIRGKRILILDDVFTTGATTEECARVLLSAGAKEVHCAAIAAVHYRKK